MRDSARVKNAVKIALLLAASLIFAGSCIQQGQKADVPLTASETPEPLAVRASDSNFQAFSHKIPEHKQFDCVSCHRREGQSKELDYAGHDSCVGCHLNQFITNKTTDQNRAMCSICHDKLETAPPTVRAFPAKFIEGFNMKFDHAAHASGKGRPPAGCASCHSPSGPGQSIQSGIDTHNNCFACHTTESKIGSCNVCHQLAPYSRTLQSQYNFKAIFRHGDHTARQGVSCNECHSLVAEAPQSRQISNITILEHRTTPGNNCLACHNGRRAFTGNNPLDVGSCTRCHTGSGFGKLPPETFPDN